MATLTFQYAAFAGGAVIVEFDVNDVNWRVSRVRCINQSDQPAAGVVRKSGAVLFEDTAPAGQTSSWNVPGVAVGWDSEEGGLIMGVYEFGARWPA